MQKQRLGKEKAQLIIGGWLRPNWPVALLEVFSKSWQFGQSLYHRNCDHD